MTKSLTKAPERGDTVEFEVKGRGKLTGTVASAYMALGNSPRVTIASGGKKYTRLAASVTVTRKAARPPDVKAGFGRQGAGEPAPARGRKYAAELLTPAEVAAILDTCSRRAPTGIRNRALLTLLYRSGLRISELLALRLSDVNLDTHSIRVLDPKSGHAQTRGFHPSAADVLARWIDKRRELGIRNGRLFCTLAGGPVSPEYVRIMLRRAAAKAGIEKRVHPHGLRHTFAAELEAAGTPVTTISKLLGHSSVAVTNTYLQHLTNSEAVTALEGVELPPLPGAEVSEPETLEDEVAALRKQVQALTARR